MITGLIEIITGLIEIITGGVVILIVIRRYRFAIRIEIVREIITILIGLVKENVKEKVSVKILQKIGIQGKKKWKVEKEIAAGTQRTKSTRGEELMSQSKTHRAEETYRTMIIHEPAYRSYICPSFVLRVHANI